MARLFVEQLTVIDCSYLDMERGLVGESWIVDLELGGALDDQGMVFDFGLVKKTIKAAIDERVDHRLLVPMHMHGLEMNVAADGVRLMLPRSGGGLIEFKAPATAACLLEAPMVDPDAVERFLVEELISVLPANVETVRLFLRPEHIDGPYYHYSHGLKKHKGQCQRIAHGHRSRLIIERDGHRSPEWERRWADRWRDIYVGTREDLVAQETRNGAMCYRFAYRAAEGEFELTLPARACYLLNTDSTVEHIAAHIAAELKREEPDARFDVRAYEGVGKGALASSDA